MKGISNVRGPFASQSVTFLFKGCASDLVVGLHITGRAPVDDAADVGLVDAHPEGDGGRNHLHLVVEERLVRFLSKNFDRADQNQFFEKKIRRNCH